MFISLNGNSQTEFSLDANKSSKKKEVKLNHKFNINLKDLNVAVDKRRNSASLTAQDKKIIRNNKTGQICLMDDSLFSPGFISTSYYGCFDVINEIQEMVAKNIVKKDIYIEKDTNFPVSIDPLKAKMFKSWYTIKLKK